MSTDFRPAPGATLAGRLILSRLKLHAPSSQADLWLVRPEDAPADAPPSEVLKIYHYGHAPSYDIPDLLLRADRRYVADLRHHLTLPGDEPLHAEFWAYAPHGTLADLLRQPPPPGPGLPEPLVRDILAQITDILAYLHAQGIQFRDLKPSNLLLTSLDPLRLVLADFGSARKDALTGGLTAAIQGTPLYLSPEAATGAPSRASDWWALGVILLEALAGSHPLAGQTGQSLHFAIRAGSIGHPANLPASLPPHWRRLLTGLFSTNAADRWGADAVRLWLQTPARPAEFAEFTDFADLAAFTRRTNEIAATHKHTLAADRATTSATAKLAYWQLFLSQWQIETEDTFKSKSLVAHAEERVTTLKNTIQAAERETALRREEETTRALLAQINPSGDPEISRQVWRRVIREKCLDLLPHDTRAYEDLRRRLHLRSGQGKPLRPVRFRRRRLLAVAIVAILLAVSSALQWQSIQEQLRREEARQIEDLRRVEEQRRVAQATFLAHQKLISALKDRVAQGAVSASQQMAPALTHLQDEHTLVLLPISPGTFSMGSDHGRFNEKPVRQVTLTQTFFIGQTEVTQSQWQAVMDRNPSNFKGASLPVENVSWDDANTYCQKLTGQGYAEDWLPRNWRITLPTETQWEYACRAGTGSESYDTDLGAIAWYAGNSGNRTHPVGQRKPNAWGLYDMLGNVSEWCSGQYEDNPDSDKSSRYWVFRGSSWGNDAFLIRAASRYASKSSQYAPNLGFRIAAVQNSPEEKP